MADVPVDTNDVQLDNPAGQDGQNLTDEQRAALQKEAAARGTQFGQQGDRLDTGLGQLGGAGASGGMQPDISHQSKPAGA